MSCVVRGCKSVWYPNCSVKFHGFPSDPDLRQAWLSKIPLKSNYYNSARICSLHFRSEDYDVNRPGRLLKSAIPKICGCCETLECLNIPSSSQETPCAKASAMPILEKYLNTKRLNEPPKKKQIVEVQEAIVLPVGSNPPAGICSQAIKTPPSYPSKMNKNETSESCQGDLDPVSANSDTKYQPLTKSSGLVACRICYGIEGELKNYTNDEFYIEAYERLTGLPFSDLPYITKFCPQCACLLKKAANFRKLCCSSYESLMEWLDTEGKITQLYVHCMSITSRRIHPVNLTSWTAENTNFLDCEHTPRNFKAKQRVKGDFYVAHMTVPKDKPAESPRGEVLIYVLDSDGAISDSDLDVTTKHQTLEVPMASETLEPSEDLRMVDSVEDIVENTTETEQNEYETEMQYEEALECEEERLCEEEIQSEERLNCEENTQFEEEIHCEEMPQNEEQTEKKNVLHYEVLDCEPNVTRKRRTKYNDVNEIRAKLLEIRDKRFKADRTLEDNFNISLFLTEESQIQDFLERRQGQGKSKGKFKCEVCLKNFKGQKILEAHVKKHEPSAGTFVCNVCKIRLKTRPALHSHKHKNHTTKFACKRCHLVTFSRTNALIHHESHVSADEKALKCHHCSTRFRKHSTYMKHVRLAHLSCGICLRTFENSMKLNYHFKHVHKEEEVLEEATGTEDPKRAKQLEIRAKRFKTNRTLEENFVLKVFLTEEDQMQDFLERKQVQMNLEGMFNCDLCLKSYKEKKNLIEHAKKHELVPGTYQCNICKITCITQRLLKTHYDFHHTKKYSCKNCPLVTYCSKIARDHIEWHKGVEYTCQHCGAKFRRPTTYMNHLRLVHPSQFSCVICVRSFANELGLKLHMAQVHKNKNNLRFGSDRTKCEECDIIFPSKKAYVRHIFKSEKHTEMAKDMLACRKCLESFESREEMDKHTHYTDTGKKRVYKQHSYKCNECGDVFTHASALYQHHRHDHPEKPYQFVKERPHLCEQCGKTFQSSGLLHQHSLIHKGLRPPKAKKKQGRHSCQLCGKTYNHKSGLNKHIKHTHLGMRMRRHKCHICDKLLSGSTNLKQHIQAVHFNIRRVRKRK